MTDKDSRHSGILAAAELAKAIRSAVRIVRAAALSGIHGALVATVKETLPLIIKVVIAVVAFLIIVPMMVFAALPNIFFGYENSKNEDVAAMTKQAMSIGSMYMSLEEFEKTQINTVVEAIVNEYAENGVAIDRVVVESSFDEDDLLWFVAINSVANRQDLEPITTESIMQMCTSRLVCRPNLSVLSGGDSTITILNIHVGKLEPKKWMDKLGFEEDDEVWASTLYETLQKSDAIERYGSYYSEYQSA